MKCKCVSARVVVIATFFVYFTFQTCEIVMEKGIESHGKVMEKSWKSHGISLRHSCGNPACTWVKFFKIWHGVRYRREGFKNHCKKVVSISGGHLA